MQTGLLVVKYTIMIRAPDSKLFPQWRSYALALICLAKIFNPVHLSPAGNAAALISISHGTSSSRLG
jgi:hypothetical protein